MKRESEALDWAEKDLECAQARGVIHPFSTAATVRKVMLLHKPEEYAPDHFAPFTPWLGWI
jgi:hypothetical protein